MASLPKASGSCPQPVIAAVNGPCVGGASRCAWRPTFGSARRQRRSVTPPILLGLIGAEMGMSYHLPRIVGTSVAADWMLTGRTVTAEEADRRGLVSELVEPDRLLDRALELAVADRGALAPLGRADDQAGAAAQHRCAGPRPRRWSSRTATR